MALIMFAILPLIIELITFGQSANQNGQMPSFGCAQFMECERQLMEMHKNCTERSRKEISKKCGFKEELKELTRLSDQRFAKFEECLLGGNGTKMDANGCWKGNESGIEQQHHQKGGCWIRMAELRKKCHSMQECCPSSKSCIQLLDKSDSSNALRRHHQLINRKTLKCRSISPLKAHSALVKWNVGELGQNKIGQKKKEKESISAGLDDSEQILHILEQRTHPKMDPPNWRAQLTANSPIPSQFMANHQPKGIFPANRRIQQERKAAAAVQQLIGLKQPQSFALPPSLDLHRMRIFAARPKLAKTFGALEQRKRNLMRGMKAELDAFGRELAKRKKIFGVKMVQINDGKLATIAAELVKSRVNVSIQPSSTIPPSSSIYSPLTIFSQIWFATTPSPPQFEQKQIFPAEKGTIPMWPMAHWEKINANKVEVKNAIMKRIGTTKIEIKFGRDKRRKMNGQRHFGHSKMLKNAKKVEITWMKGNGKKRGNLLGAKIHAGMARKAKMGQRTKEIRRSPQKLVGSNLTLPKFWAEMKYGWAELEELRRELVEQLKKFIAKNGGNEAKNRVANNRGLNGIKEKKVDIGDENHMKLDQFGIGLPDHCHLYSTCKNELSRLQSSPCTSSHNGGRLIPGPPRRRFGRCNSRLLPLFERIDGARAELEKRTEKCVEEEMAKGRRKKKECPWNWWPILPTFSPQMNCPERISILHQHCRKLGQCCDSLEGLDGGMCIERRNIFKINSCKLEVDGSELGRQIRRDEQKLAKRSAKCQIQAQEMFKRMLKERKKI